MLIPLNYTPSLHRRTLPICAGGFIISAKIPNKRKSLARRFSLKVCVNQTISKRMKAAVVPNHAALASVTKSMDILKKAAVQKKI
jgi:hypothetical protein